MNISHLETFLNVVRLKSFHRAADVLFLSQPTVSARIKLLEQELGKQLFIRQGGKVFLTANGKDFITYAEKIIQLYDEGKEHLQNKREGSEVIIGANAIVAQYFIPYALPLLKKMNQQQHFKFMTAEDDVLYENLLEEKVDFVFINEIKSEKVHQYRLLDNSLKLVAFPNPDCEEKEITINQLWEKEFVSCNLGKETEEKIQRFLFDAKIEPSTISYVDHIEVAKAIIKSYQSIGFLPVLCIKNELAKEELIEVDIQDFFQSKQSVYLTYKKTSTNYPKILNDIKKITKAFVSNEHINESQSKGFDFQIN